MSDKFLELLDKNPKHKEIFLDYVAMYNNDESFQGSMREIQQMAMIDLLMLLNMEYHLDAGSAEEVEKMKEEGV